jgi:putative membrane protein
MSVVTRERISVFLKGMAMGMADSVPGVSGGTIAAISGIYETLINALKHCNPMALHVWHQSGFRAFWQHINGAFLLTLLLGIGSSLALMANAVLYLLDHHPIPLMTFFMGLVLASCFMMMPQVGRLTAGRTALLIVGFAITASTAVLNPAAGSTSLLYVFISAMLAICAMILPGISGAFILLLLGMYEYVLDALRSLDILVILVFVAGCATGLLSFAHLLSWTFGRFREQSYAFLTGMLGASLIVLWPWRGMTATSHSSQQGEWLLPWQFEAATGEPSQWLLAVATAIVGAMVIMAFVRYSNRVPAQPS